MWAWLLAEAVACDSLERKVVGFTASGDRVLVRTDCPTCGFDLIDLRLLELPAGTLVKEWPILHHGDDASLRGPRWTAAEKELVAMGLKIDPGLRPLAGPTSGTEWGPWSWGAWKVRVVREKVDQYVTTYTLVATDGAREVRVREVGRGGNAVNDPSFDRAYLAPGGEMLVLQDTGSCGREDEVGITAAEVRAALAGPPPKP
jgi:hypothetical protein